MMLGLIHLGDVTGQCAAGLNPNYDENGVFTSCTEGSPAPPNCVSGQVTTFDDGSYGCTPGVTAQSVGGCGARLRTRGGSPLSRRQWGLAVLRAARALVIGRPWVFPCVRGPCGCGLFLLCKQGDVHIIKVCPQEIPNRFFRAGYYDVWF